MTKTAVKSMDNRQALHRMGGLTMIELLIAMVLGLSLTAGVMQVYVNNTQTERDQESRARMQESGRFAISYLSRELRMAGYLGCLATIDANSVNNTLDGPPASFQPTTGLQGWEASGTGLGVVSNSANNVATVSSSGGNWSSSGGNVLATISAVPTADVIRIWNTEGTGALINSVTPGVSPVVNSDLIDIEDGDILLLSDCQRADLVHACEVAEVGGTSVNATLSSACAPGNVASSSLVTQAGGELAKLNGTMFYIGKRGNVAANPPSLFRSTLSSSAGLNAAEELIEGIESLQVLYGINADNDNRKTVDAYVTAAQVGDWTRVVSVRISVLVQSLEDFMLPAPQPYTFNGVIYDGSGGNGALPADRRLRRVFTSTVTLRNRAVGL